MIEKYYKYKLEHDKAFVHELLLGIEFKNEWVTIQDGVMIIKKGYAWDGCTPKYKIGRFVIGVPDGKKDECKWASLVHDIFCQFIETIPVSKETTLTIFDEMLEEAGWKYRKLYVWAVDKFGPQKWIES